MVGKYSCGNSQSTNYRFEEIEEGEGDTVPMVTPKTSSNREFFSLSLSLSVLSQHKGVYRKKFFHITNCHGFKQ